MSHCVNHTMRDLIKNWRSEMSKIVLLTDGSSPVPGFEYAVDKLMTDVRSVGYVLPLKCLNCISTCKKCLFVRDASAE